MFASIGRVLRYTKWTNRVQLSRRMVYHRPSGVCAVTYQTPGVHLITPQLLMLIGDFGRNHRCYNTATYEDVRDASKSHNVWIIDVRDQREIARTGSIKNAINIPLTNLEAALQFTPEYFFNRYGVTKPYLDSNIIFTCRSGRLSKVAYELAESMGYKKLMNFDGGYLLYEKHYLPMAQIVSYEDVKRIQPSQFLIDVRNRDEVKETGLMPHAFNIPLPELHDTFELDDDAFLAKVGHAKPAIDASIISTCKSGARALKAANALIEMGYSNVSYYKGSWIEWSAKESQKAA